jgi:protoporphyrinogen oxidase
MPSSSKLPKKTVIIGAGPAGLGVAYELTRHRSSLNDIHMVDKNDLIGGLARTHNFDGNLFDVGPHRFFTKNEEVKALWHEVLGDEFIAVPRLTRMLYKNKLFKYPIKLSDVVKKLGMVDISRAAVSYATLRWLIEN